MTEMSTPGEQSVDRDDGATGVGSSPPTVLPAPPAPSFLICFFDTLDQDAEGWLANCPICDCEGMTIRAEYEQGVWYFSCPDGCEHLEVVQWLRLDDIRLYGEVERRELMRLWVCMMLASTIEICEALLEGEPVVVGALDADWVARFTPPGALVDLRGRGH